jgi:carbonic anhydrase
MNYLVALALLLALSPVRSFTQELLLTDTHKPVQHQSKAVPSAPEEIWSDLMAGNKRFVAGGTKAQQLTKLRKSLVNGQHPEAAVLSCSDSRVPPEILFDQTLGKMFVVRSAGNVADATVLIILGHEHCGAVTAACAVEKPSSPNLRVIMDKIYPSVAQARNYSEKEALIDSAILENIHESARDVLAQSEVLRHAFKEGKLTIIEAIYSLESGEVRRLGKLSLIPPAYKLDVGDVVRVQ